MMEEKKKRETGEKTKKVVDERRGKRERNEDSGKHRRGERAPSREYS